MKAAIFCEVLYFFESIYFDDLLIFEYLILEIYSNHNLWAIY